MTKYRLNIKYPIEEVQGKMLADLYRFNGKEVHKIGEELENDMYQIIVTDDEDLTYQRWIFKSWIEEIKDSDFDKWLVIAHERHGIKFDKPMLIDCWQASQENRDLLYVDLLEYLEEKAWSTDLLKILMKIKDELK